MKDRINVPNLIYLNSEYELDRIGFLEYDEFGEDESPKSPKYLNTYRYL